MEANNRTYGIVEVDSDSDPSPQPRPADGAQLEVPLVLDSDDERQALCRPAGSRLKMSTSRGHEARGSSSASDNNVGVPCDRCGAFVPFSLFSDHAAAHLAEDDEQWVTRARKSKAAPSASSNIELLPCEVCGDLFMLSEYAAHLAEHQAKQAAAGEAELSNFRTPEAVAARLVEQLRKAAEAPDGNGQPALPNGSVANFDLAVDFLRCMHSFREALGKKLAEPQIVYHWTQRTNFRGIIDSNLRVPDGRTVFHTTDTGYYGRGIYTSPDFNYGRAYAYQDGACFICLALPGRQWASRYPQDCSRPRRSGYDSHVSADRKRMEWVFFSSAQLLPCFLVDDSNHLVALAAVRDSQQHFRDALAEEESHQTEQPSKKKRRPQP
mmetsp:Transcript_10723/g.19944  ORF Transcript_10723/g.19944 Transcript_10723/m.19944 type:complete len:381 (-) Transcript_10723:327-1469(-)